MRQASVASQLLSSALPLHTDGMRIGLLGGSFNPPHEAHRAISQFAMKRLRLDRVWWLISPGNPLKSHDGLRDLAARAQAARAIADDPRIAISCLEAVIGTRYTFATISFLRRRCAGARFVWIMGADNLAQFHRWQNWRHIADLVPLAVIDRPPLSLRALASPAALTLSHRRLPERDAPLLPRIKLPAWVFLTGMKSAVSSTALRNPDGSWKR